MNIAILGTNMGQMHANIFKSIPGARIVGIAGRDGNKTGLLAEKLSTKAFTNAMELISLREVDAVVICLPTDLHCEYAVASLRAGKHVFCETPLTFNRSESEKIELEVRKSGKKFMIALFNRFQTPYVTVRDYIASGKLGKILSVYAGRRSPDCFASRDIILNLMIHEFDYIRWMLGRPKTVYCKGLSSSDGIQMQAFAVLDYGNTNVVLEGSTCMPNSFPFSTSLSVAGEKGAMDLKWFWGGERPEYEVKYFPYDGQAEVLAIRDEDPYEAECRYFTDCLKGIEDGSRLEFTSGLDAVKMAISARESLLSGEMREIVY